MKAKIAVAALKAKLWLWDLKFYIKFWIPTLAYLAGLILGIGLGWSFTWSHITGDFWWWPWEIYEIKVTKK
jgi:hypothetical protein